MINYQKFQLDNGLKVIFHQDKTTPIATLNIIYQVGSKNEDPKKTGWAHLLEHLMFEGTTNNKNFDEVLELAGGTNNAFTNEDYTNYYIVIPKNNIELALWLEADRMQNLKLDEQSVDTQKKVVIEEFKQMVLNEPYEDAMMHLCKLAYKTHPYNWTTIGKKISHIEKANPEEIRNFYNKFYSPNNAILSIGGDFEFDDIKKLVEKYFGKIKSSNFLKPNLPIEKAQNNRRFAEVTKNVPHDRLYMAFHYGQRMSKDFYVFDIITDILDDGKSARFYRNLIKNNHFFDEVEAFITSSLDSGLIVFIAQPSNGIKLNEAEIFLWQELEKLKLQDIEDWEIQKTINTLEFSNNIIKTNIYQKTQSLGYYEMLSNCDILNNEIDNYKEISKQDIKNFATNTFVHKKANVLYYKSLKN